MTPAPIVVTCPKGLGPVLAREIAALGCEGVSPGATAVTVRGTMEDAMKLNLYVRTGHRVLMQVGEFRARDPKELYRGVKDLPWETWIDAQGYLCVHSSVLTRAVKDPRFATLTCKDAVVDRIRDRCGRRPDSGSNTDRTVVSLFWEDDHARVYLDTSGEPLSRRGYRKLPWKAPMQETLAAGIILSGGWNGRDAFVNPMCGSGTLAIEAALIALRRAPGLFRERFGFMHIKDYRRDIWTALRKKAVAEAQSRLDAPVIATDSAPEAVAAAKKNAAAAGVEHLVEFDVCDFSETRLPPPPGVIYVNPEYGERMGEASELTEQYRNLGSWMKKNGAGYLGYIFSGNPTLARKIGLNPKRSMNFHNSNLECRLLEYELYRGSRSDKTEDIS